MVTFESAFGFLKVSTTALTPAVIISINKPVTNRASDSTKKVYCKRSFSYWAQKSKKGPYKNKL